MKRCSVFKKSTLISLVCVLMSAVLFSSCSYLDRLEDKLDSLLSDSTQTAYTQPPTVPEVTTTHTDDDTVTYYGYENLSDESLKTLYMAIHENAHKRLGSVEFEVEGFFSENQIFEALTAYKNDHPEVFWLNSRYSYFYEEGATNLYLFYTMNNTKLIEAKDKFNKIVDEVIANAPKNVSDFELELYINDYICDNCEYNHEAAERDEVIANEHNAYGVFVEKKAVCEGYARAFQILCNRLGINCVSITGSVDEDLHQWNCIQLDNEWYHIDVTWNDSEEYGNISRYDYFNLSTEQIKKTHWVSVLYNELDSSFSTDDKTYNVFVPDCNSDKYNYYKYKCVTLTDIDDADEVIQSLADTASKRGSYFHIIIGDELDFEYANDQIINYGYFINWIDGANDTNDYSPKLGYNCQIYTKEDIRVLTTVLEYY